MPALANVFTTALPRILSVTVLTVSVAASYWVTSAWWSHGGQRIHRSDIRSSTPVGEPVNPFASANGTHLIAYFFTASDCGWSRLLSQSTAVKDMAVRLRSLPATSYAQVSVVGVDLDEDIDVGLKTLSQLGKGTFDQVIVGGSWLNEQIVRLVWRDGVIEPSLPQVFIIERPINTESYVSDYKIVVDDDRIVGTLVGERQITNWMRDGYPIPPRGAVPSADARKGL